VRRRPSQLVLVGAGLLTLVGFALRIPGIDQTLYGDENFTYSIISRNGLSGVWHDVYHTSITPPLHYYLAWLSVQFGGDGTVLVRLPSLILGTAIIPLAFLLGRRIGGVRSGMVAAALLAFSPFAIWYADESRAYATMMFLLALSSYGLLRALDGDGRRWWAIYALSACAALWSHYTAVFVIVGEAAWAAWAHREYLRSIAGANIAVVLGYLPWLPGFLAQRRNDAGIHIIGDVGPFSVGALYQLPLRTLVGHPIFGLGDFPGAVKGLLLLLALLGAGVALARWRRPALPSRFVGGAALQSEAGLIVILTVATPLGLLVYAAAGSSLFIPRNLSASLPAFAVLCGLLLGRASEFMRPAFAGGLMAAVAVVLGLNAVDGMSDDNRRPPFREAARYLDGVAAPGDPVVEIPLALQLDQRLPPTDLDLYFRRSHPLTRGGPDSETAWRQLSAGRDLYLVAPSQLLAFTQVRGQPRGREAPAGLLRRARMLGGPQGRAIVRSETTFPGIIPVTAVRYHGIVDGRLERRVGRESISWSLGRDVTVAPGAARGSVEKVSSSNTPLQMTGWALNATRPEPVDWILFFSGGRLFAVTAGGSVRPDIASTQGGSSLFSGFGISPTGGPADHAGIRVFAVVGHRATELPFSAGAKRAVGR
jgi:4-amino-4-deoxy-L-arabinose transferase-like glycosyltransferase